MLHNIKINEDNFSESIESFDQLLTTLNSDIQNTMQDQIEVYDKMVIKASKLEGFLQETLSEEDYSKVIQLLYLRNEINMIEYQVYFNLGKSFQA